MKLDIAIHRTTPAQVRIQAHGGTVWFAITKRDPDDEISVGVFLDAAQVDQLRSDLAHIEGARVGFTTGPLLTPPEG